MQKSHACVRYVYSRVTIYYNSRIELKWRRSLHHCALCDVAGLKEHGVPCGAIHYGVCTSVSLPVPGGNNKKIAPAPAVAIVAPSTPAVAVVAPQPIQTPSKPQLSVSAVTKEKEIFQKDLQDGEEKDKENGSILGHVSSSMPTVTTDLNKENKPKKKDILKTQTFVQRSAANIPKFFFPAGVPPPTEESESILQRVSQEFSKLEGGKAHKQDMGTIAKACNLPLYWKCALYHAAGGEKHGHVTFQMFAALWRKVTQTCHDEASKFIRLLSKPGLNYLDEDDFVPIIQDIVDTHPGLTFLMDAPEFHSRYVNTVIARIFYCINRSWTGKITRSELNRSNFLQTVALLEEEDDINQITEFFSYEHFYVIYCKFWELDKDHDLSIDKADLARHNDHAMSSRVIDRIFSGAVTRGQSFKDGKMSYPEFVWFLMSEEDKKHPTSVEYWFRCMDLDGDGVVSMYEMEYFYDEQMQKMEALGIEKLPFEDALCQMLDLVRPNESDKITLTDLKNCKMTNIFFDTFFNLDKFLDHEQRDPFANMRDMEMEGPELSDWDKYAAEEYEILVAEEGANDQEEIHYEDDFEPDEEEVPQEEIIRAVDPVQHKSSPRMRSLKTVADDIYDFSNENLGY